MNILDASLFNIDVYKQYLTDEMDLNCEYNYVEPTLSPPSSNYVIWPLFNNLTDYNGNFGNITINTSDTENENKTYMYNSFVLDGTHWLQTPCNSDDAYDLEGFSSINKEGYGLGVGFMLSNSPSNNKDYWIWHAGNVTNYMGIKVNSLNALTYVRCNNNNNTQSVDLGIIDINKWYYVFITNITSTSISNVYLDGILKGSISNVIVTGITGSSTPIKFGLGIDIVSNVDSGLVQWDTGKSGSVYTFSNNNLTVTRDDSTVYSSCPVTSYLTNDTKYYWELNYTEGTYTWIGVAPYNSDFSGSLAAIGCCVATHNGRRWNAQTGGGTNWKSSIPAGSVIGFAWDGSATYPLSIYVDGVLYGTLPYSLTGTFVPAIGSQRLATYTLNFSSNSWKYSPPSSDYQQLINYVGTSTGNNSDMLKGRIRLIRMLNGSDFTDEISYYSNYKPAPTVIAKNIKTNIEYDITQNVYKGYTAGEGLYSTKYPNGYIGIKTPNIIYGKYKIYSKYNNITQLLKQIKINNINNYLQTMAISDNFSNSSLTLKMWDTAHKAWGGNNGGCVNQLVEIYNQQVHCKCLGDLNENISILGVNNLGSEKYKYTRIGSCLVSKKYFTPGVFTFNCKYPINLGACAAIWLFHYEEIYPGSDMWNNLLNENIHKQGNAENGYYLVRNHEIDIEIPSALKTSTNMENASFENGRFNTWLGELRNWEVPNNDCNTNDALYSEINDPAYWSEYTDNFMKMPIAEAINDGNFHKMKIDWDTTNEWVKFYVDDNLVVTNTTHVPDIPMKIWFGVWYPSTTNNYWAGASADYISDEFILDNFDYVPHNNSYYRLITETYPSVGLRPLSSANFKIK